MQLYLVLVVVVVVAILALIAARRRRAAANARPTLSDPSTARPDIYVDGRQIPDRRSEPRPAPVSPGLRREDPMEERGAVAFVPPPSTADAPAKTATNSPSSPEDLGLDLTPVVPPAIEALPPERGRED